MEILDCNSKSKLNFTKRELEILKYIVKGKNNSQIAQELIISNHTVKAHICNIFQKMHVGNRVIAAVTAVRENIV